MNAIIFAGRISEPNAVRINKCYELIVPESGSEVMLYADGGTVRFVGGEIAVIPPLCKYTPEAENGGVLHVLIERALLSVKQPKIFTDAPNGGILHAAVQAETYFRGGRKNDCIIAALGNLLVSYTVQGAERERKLSPVTEQIRAELDRHVSEPLFSVENCLKSLPLNYDYLRKLFKKETGETPHGYLLNARMELARGLLLSGISNTYSSYSVSQIAEACGFSDPLYFSRVFKNNFGVSPSEYKKQ